MSKILKIKVVDFKKIKVVEYTPEGNVIKIGGKNGAGKSSLLDSIKMGLGGKKAGPSKPVRDGQEKSITEIDIPGYKIIQTNMANGGYYLKVKDANGASIATAQAFLNSLEGQVGFDPHAFANMDQKAQAEMLLEICEIDTTKLDSLRGDNFENRRDANREVKTLAAQLNGMESHKDIPTEEQSASNLVVRIGVSQKLTEESGRLNKEIEKFVSSISAKEDEIKRLQDDIHECKVAAGSFRQQLAELDKPENTDTLKEELDQIEDTNRKVRENIRYDEIAGKLEKAELIADEHDQAISKIDEQKADMIQNADFPVDGLGFSDDGFVTYNDILFSQASTAEQIRVGARIALAKNPKLRVIHIKDGSLLDSDSHAEIQNIADETDSQIWIECVSEDADDMDLIIEDGTVQGVEVEESVGAE